MKNPGHIIPVVMGMIFFLVGLGLVFGGVKYTISTKEKISESEVIMGEITEIHTWYDSDGDSHHDVFVEYEYDGKEYDRELNSYSSSMYEGKEIELYVRPDAPGDATAVSMANFGSYMLLGMGAIFAIVGFFIMRTGVKGLTGSSVRRLKKNGKAVYATVTNAYLDMSTEVNGRSPYWLECKYEDTYTGNTYLFRSENLWEMPDPYIGQQILVYVDVKDWKKYHVDMDSLKKPAGMVYDYR